MQPWSNKKGARSGVWLTCPCGKQFYRWAKKAVRSRCCSKECQYKYARRPSGLTYDIKVQNRAWFKEGDDNPYFFKLGHAPINFKGDEAAYSSIHKYVKYHYGSPEKCEVCGSTSDLQWANKSWEYRRDRDDWMSLCRTCHQKHDRNGGWGIATARWPEEFAK